MSVPVDNLYYLLCYAWDRLEARSLVDVEALRGQHLAELFARVLARGTSLLLRRGVDRGYVELDEDLRVPRGKLFVSETLKRSLRTRGRVECLFDEFFEDVPHNRILKATLRRLSRTREVHEKRRRELHDLAARFGNVADVHLTDRDFAAIRLHRNNAHYRFLLNACQLLRRQLLPDPKTGSWRMQDFSGSEQEMGHLFEKFVRGFIARELGDVRILPSSYRWNAISGSDDAAALLPRLLTDVPISRGGVTTIIECKFVANPLVSRRGVQRLRSGHLYQLYAYLSQLTGRVPGGRPRGLLLYAAVDRPLALRYVLGGFDVEVRTVDLDRPWAEIDAEMRRIVARSLSPDVRPVAGRDD